MQILEYRFYQMLNRIKKNFEKNPLIGIIPSEIVLSKRKKSKS